MAESQYFHNKVIDLRIVKLSVQLPEKQNFISLCSAFQAEMYAYSYP
jgi:hypothetical protein